MESTTNHILWAVDLSQDPKTLKNSTEKLKELSKRLKCAVKPITIIGGGWYGMLNPTEENAKVLDAQTEKELSSYVKKAGLKYFLPPTVIRSATSSRREMAAALCKYAASRNVRFIFASTHSRKILPLRMGGFVESLINTSTVPLILIDPIVKAKFPLTNILIPTDFSKDAKKRLEEIATISKAVNGEVTLFNKIEIPYLSPELDATWLGEAYQTAETRNLLVKYRTSKAKSWLNLLDKKNIKSQFVIEPQRRTIGSEILDAARKYKVGLIIMQLTKGRGAASSLGITPRDVITEGKCPILVFPANYKAKRAVADTGKEETTSYTNTHQAEVTAPSH